MSENVDDNFTTFDLTLDQEVTVTESSYPPFPPLDFITTLGGVLGLWLGLGVAQLVEYVLGLVSWFTHSNVLQKNK